MRSDDATIPAGLKRFVGNRLLELLGLGTLVLVAALALSLATWQVDDPSLNHATDAEPENLLGLTGAIVSDMLMQLFGLGVIALIVPPMAWAVIWLGHNTIGRPWRRAATWIAGGMATAALASVPATPASWPLPMGLGGVVGDAISGPLLAVSAMFAGAMLAPLIAAAILLVVAVALVFHASAFTADELLFSAHSLGERGSDWAARGIGAMDHVRLSAGARMRRLVRRDMERTDDDDPADEPESARRGADLLPRLRQLVARFVEPRPEPQFERTEPVFEPLADRREPRLPMGDFEDDDDGFDPPDAVDDDPGDGVRIARGKTVAQAASSVRARPAAPRAEFQLPPLNLLSLPKPRKRTAEQTDDMLQENARMLESVLEDFGVRGAITEVKPGPVVTLYELEPAPGIKSSRVIGLADDIARSMSAVSARVAVVPGRNVIGIELPNAEREIVYLRELLSSQDFAETGHDLALALGKDIGGGAVIADLARMPHLLIAGTTGSGKSVGINTMILSLLYRLSPEHCKLILIDPKMLELSVYDGIPHLLAPVVTDPRKAVVALKWTVREMGGRYRNMSKLGVRNIHGFNARVRQAIARGEQLTRTVQTGFDEATGKPVYEDDVMDLQPMPFIVVIIDEMADLMMVAGKEIEGAVQRLAQMARAAGIHLITATQRPSVDVITGTIKANFPTRVSFQVTSKIDSRTILGEQGAEQLLGQGDMLYMAGGGRISRVHGPFVSDEEVEKVVAFLKKQAAPDYLEAVTEERDDETGGYQLPGFDEPPSSGDDLYDKAVAVVIRDKKVSTSYIQRRLSIGYNRAASIIERMEEEGIISAANHAGKREILVGTDSGDDD